MGNDTVGSITLDAGVDAVGYTFGELAPASLAGVVYSDANNDGVKQAGESGIAGVTVTLTGTDDLGQTITLPMTTAADGTYSFTNLRPGTYTLTETQPAAYLDGKDAAGLLGGVVGVDQVSGIVVAAGDAGAGYNFGELTPARVVGFVYVDANQNGMREAGASGIAGVTVTLTGTDDLGTAVRATATTATDGSYHFRGLRPGTYALAEAQPAEFLDGNDAAGTLGGVSGNDRISDIVVAPGGNGTGYTFGELRSSALSGSVFVDLDGDGVRDGGEAGIRGVAVTLTGTDDRGNAVHLATTTAADGTYGFTNLRPGTYTLTERQPTAYRDGLDAAGAAGGTVGNDTVGPITLTAGVNAGGYTFGERGALLAGTVYVDAQNAGRRDASEVGLGGVPVRLLDATGKVVASTVTTPDGVYSFHGLPADSYTVVESVPDHFGTSTPRTRTVDLPLAGLAGQDFGLTAGSLAGSVYVDTNNNGVRDAGETGASGVTVTLTGKDDTGRPVNRIVTTDANGTYRFDGLLAGTYAIAESQPTGLLDGQDTAGTLGGVAGDDRINGVRMTLGAAGTGYDFGELAPASLAGFAYLDLHRDGVMSAGDVGIAHVLVRLTGTDDRGAAVDRAIETQADGAYRFDGLRPGSYTLREQQPATFRDSWDNVGSQGGVAGNDLITTAAIGSGTRGEGNNFGELPGPACKLNVLVPYGTNSLNYLQWRRSLAPTRFDYFHPRVGPLSGSWRRSGGVRPGATRSVDPTPASDARRWRLYGHRRDRIRLVAGPGSCHSCSGPVRILQQSRRVLRSGTQSRCAVSDRVVQPGLSAMASVARPGTV